MQYTASAAALLLLAGLVSAGPPQTHITISKETTHITEPLTEDGYPDYLAALNTRLSEGVTPENNAAVPFWQAFGPSRIRPEFRERYFEMLGVEPLPEVGDYLSLESLGDLYSELEGERIHSADLESAGSAPWSKAEFPVIARWLEGSEQQLDLILAASEREQCWFPLVSDGVPPVLYSECPEVGAVDDLEDVLGARVMLRIGSGDVEGAMEDLLAWRRLGRHMAQGPSVILQLIGQTMEKFAMGGETHLAHRAGLEPGLLRAYARRLRALPSFPPAVRFLDTGERWMCLDMICALANGSAEFANAVLTGFANQEGGVDYNGLLRMANECFDRAVSACRLVGLANRRAAAEAAGPRRPGELEALWGTFTAKGRAEIIIYVLVHPISVVFERSVRDEAVAKARMQLSLISLALGAHRAEHGAYPQSLGGLGIAPPVDPFTEKPIVYAREGKGFVLKSPGPDGKFATREEEEDSDDLVIRVP